MVNRRRNYADLDRRLRAGERLSRPDYSAVMRWRRRRNRNRPRVYTFNRRRAETVRTRNRRRLQWQRRAALTAANKSKQIAKIIMRFL